MDGNGSFDPVTLLPIAVLGATLWFVFAARRRRAPGPLIAAAAVGLFSGTMIAVLGATHTIAVIGGALRRAPFQYDFRLYSLVLLGVLLMSGGARCLLPAWKLTRGDAAAWRAAVGATVMLLAVNLPLMPIQGFAVGFSVFLGVNLVTLLLVRPRLRLEPR